jgi:tripartite-type tricarboxylate transporter receptor subunit TctC
MRPERRRFVSALGAALAGAALPSFAQAPGWPGKPIHIIVPFTAGSATDILARTFGERLTAAFGQPTVVENHPGAGGTIASDLEAKAAPDGYTLIVVASGHAINPYLYKHLPYDTFGDFTPISLLASSPNMLLVKADAPYKNLGDLLAAAKAQPGKLSYGMAGNGTSTHLAGELLKYMAKVDIVAVPYKGGAPVINDLLGGHIPMSFNNIPESIGQIQAGKLRPLGVTTAKRATALPDVPTIAEAGVPGYDTMVWWGLLGPGKMPVELAAKISRDCAEVLHAPAVRDKLAKLGAIVDGSTPADFAELIKSDYDKWGPIIQAAGIKGE